MKRDFSIYSKKELLGYKQLERAIKTDAMASILRAKDIQSEAHNSCYMNKASVMQPIIGLVVFGATDKPCGVRTVANPKLLLNGT